MDIHSAIPIVGTSGELTEQMMLRASGLPPRYGNRIKVLLNCSENFTEWEAALLEAKESICIEMYIFAPDSFGKRLRDILLTKLAEGIHVALVYDWLGSLNAHLRGFFKPLKAAGAEIRSYNPPKWTSGVGIFSRNHRKSIIIDEQIAFVSGLCISNAWKGKPEKGIEAWRDTGLRLEGPIVQDILDAFEDTLIAAGGTPLKLKRYAREDTPPAGSVRARVLATTPENINTLRFDLNVIGLSSQNLWITDAYFMPTRMYVQTLINAAKAGVDVRILVPRTSDIKWIGTVSRTQYRPLLEAGVRVFEWNGTMIHAKCALIDGQWARVGSTNLNMSSWYVNRELDISIEDSSTVYLLERIFLNDLNHATEVILNEGAHTEFKEARRKKFKLMQRGRTKAVMRQAIQLSHAFDIGFSGTRLVDESEAWAFLTIGITILLLAVTIYFIPQIIIWPLLLLLIIGGSGTALHAIKQLRKFKQNKHR
ncbi:phospholipase D-like domain-containing protein [Neisseria sp. S1]|uniref:phospholipase D-like domain-containing protein n=1 Tax=Neisseria sp. S1 TaxID=3318354 RepID=UPI003A853C05